MTSSRTIVVTGATGGQGGATARHLLAEGWQVRALVRNETKPEVDALRRRGAEIVVADLDDLDQVRAAVAGAHGVFSVQTILGGGGLEAEVRQGMNLAHAAGDTGVAHFVYTSVGCAHRNTGIPHFESKWEIERCIRKIGLPATILRPGFFMDNFVNFGMIAMVDDRVRLRLGLQPHVGLQLISTESIGLVAAAAFDRPEVFIGRQLEIAGDELTGPQMADVFGAVSGMNAYFEQKAIDEIEKAQGPDIAEMYRFFNHSGFRADIPALRALHPKLDGLESLSAWLRRIRWFGPATVPNPWNRIVIEEFRENGGKVGHAFQNSPLLLMTTTGRRTKRKHTVPMIYLADADRYVVFATWNGASANPAWFDNLRAAPKVVVEVGGETFRATAEEVHGEERAALYAKQVRAEPRFAGMQARTSRPIPVIVLQRAE